MFAPHQSATFCVSIDWTVQLTKMNLCSARLRYSCPHSGWNWLFIFIVNMFLHRTYISYLMTSCHHYFVDLYHHRICDPLHSHCFPLTPAWISDYIYHKMWVDISYPFPNFIDVFTSQLRFSLLYMNILHTKNSRNIIYTNGKGCHIAYSTTFLSITPTWCVFWPLRANAC